MRRLGRFQRLTLKFTLITTFVAAAAVTTGVFLTQTNAAEPDPTVGNASPAAQAYCSKDVKPTEKRQACMSGWDNPTGDCQEMWAIMGEQSDLITECQKAQQGQKLCTQAYSTGRPVAEGATSHACPNNAVLAADKKDQDKEECVTAEEKKTTACDADKAVDEIKKLCDDMNKEELADNEELSAICKANKEDQDKEEDNADEISKLKKEIATLKKELNKEEDKPDNQYGKYVNGANEYQEIRINRAPGDGNPAIIFFNGGGGTADDGQGDLSAPAANARGYSTFVATYRLGHSGIYYQYDDVMRAIKHVRNNAGMYGIDPNRIAIWGDSYGGFLTMRAAGSGKSGAKVAVGWSAPTNAFTAIFHSPEAFSVAATVSTCIPSDLETITSTLEEIDKVTGEANEAQEGEDVSKEIDEEDAATDEDATPSEDTGGGGSSEASGGIQRLAAKKLIECLDNFTSGSPALFAQPGTPPVFLGGFETDPFIHPGQLVQMADKVRALGQRADLMILPGEPAVRTLQSPSGTKLDGVNGLNHLGYNEKFVGPTLDFIGEYLHPEKKAEAAAPAAPGAPATPAAAQPGCSDQGGSSSGGSCSVNAATPPGGDPQPDSPSSTDVDRADCSSGPQSANDPNCQRSTCSANAAEHGTCGSSDPDKDCRNRGGELRKYGWRIINGSDYDRIDTGSKNWYCVKNHTAIEARGGSAIPGKCAQEPGFYASDQELASTEFQDNLLKNNQHCWKIVE